MKFALPLLILLAGSPVLGLDPIVPTRDWPIAAPAEAGIDVERLQQAIRYAQSGGGSGFVTRFGWLVAQWGDSEQTYDLKSTTKSIGVTALGLAIADGKVTLDTKAASLHPTFGTPPKSNEQTEWLEAITLRHLATQTAGFEKPGGHGKLLFEPGTKWHYSDAGPNWLAECLTLSYRQDMDQLLFERVFTPIGISRKDLRWRKNQYRDHEIDGLVRREFGSGIHANVDAMARIGLLYLNEGRWGDEQLLPAEFARLVCGTFKQVVGLPEYDDEHGNASDHYGLLWWNNADGSLEYVPRDACWSWGLYDSLIVVIPSLDIVVSRAGKGWERNDGAGHYDVLKPFLEPIVQSAKPTQSSHHAPRDEAPQSKQRTANQPSNAGEPRLVTRSVTATIQRPEITGIDWAPPDSVIRKAKGSDNWPMTWAEDDAQYTAYGDGWGFEPRVEKKLSLGLCRITGGPDDFRGVNLRSDSAEQTGDGARGRKASGMLCVDGVLYMLVRNADNSQLAWSDDHGKTWAWADWKFTTSFGCPTFINYGRDYAGAPENFVYVVSFDSDSAYEAADRLVLARVPRDHITEREAYQFFHEIDPFGGSSNYATWSRDINLRGAILERPGKCYRCGVTYNAPLQTYLLAMMPGGDTRETGGLAVYASPQPWGPWRTIFETDDWDIGPGESASFPTKWMSEDGRSVHLVFSGNDCFSVRKGTLQLNDE